VVRGKRILITGGSGFLGYKLASTLCCENELHFTFRNKCPEIGESIGHQVNLTDFSSIHPILKKIEPEILIHTAAETNTDICETNPGYAMNLNVEATKVLLEECKPYSTHFIFCSTDLVFDGSKGAYIEKDIVSPVMRYGWTKAEAEKYVAEAEIPSLILRISLIYGTPAPSGKGGFIKWCLGGLQKGEKVKSFIDEYRTPIYLGDLVNIISESAEIGLEGILHVGGPETISRYELAKRIALIFECDPNLVEPASLNDYNGNAARPADTSLNISRLQKLLVTHPQNVTQGLLKLKSDFED
jgi:dTDP-4-dehydrorhamnose reductase